MAGDAAKALRTQGVYYLVTGLWPIVHRRSFEALTGPKADVFVVETAGGLFAAIGVTILQGSRQHRPARAVHLLGVLTALGSVGAIARHAPRLRAVYLLDAALECVLAFRVLRGRVSLPL